MTLQGTVALVTGASRGCGRGMAVELGAAGATVYVTGRSTRGGRSPMNRPETIEETADRVTAAGGVGIPVCCDHTDITDVDALARRIRSEQDGQLDVLVDDVWGGDPLVQWGTPFWEHDIGRALGAVRNGVDSHLITANRLLPLLVTRGRGLLIEITDGDTDYYMGCLPYDVVKTTMRRLGHVLADELHPHGVTALALTPGFLRSEAMLDNFGVTEENWRDATAADRHFGISETPHYIGRAVVALAGDPDVARWGGRTTSTWELMRAYGFTDLDGSQPDCGRYFADAVFGDHPNADPADYR